MNRTLAGWSQLLRAPNLLTAPGDAMAGAALAALYTRQSLELYSFLLVGLAALAFYCFGLILNDISDIPEDRLARPERPLVSGAVPLTHAWAAVIICVAVGLVVAFAAGPRPFATALVLILLITAYNRMTKHSRMAGPVTMGMCRGVSLLMGAALAGWPLFSVLAALGLAGYIADVTRLAEVEDRPVTFGVVVKRPPLWFAAAFFVAWLPAAVRPVNILAVAAAFLIATAGVAAVYVTCRGLSQGTQKPQQTRQGIGRLLRSLIVLQAAFLMLAGQALAVLPAVVWLVFFLPANHLIHKRIAAS